MPNHITNRLTVVGNTEQIDKVLDFIKCEKTDNPIEPYGIGTIDFNKITPTPKWVRQEDLTRETEERYGVKNCWFEWNRTNWGAKWNAYRQPDERNTHNTIYFLTAWSNVRDLIIKLSWIFPEVTLEYGWADEDFGANVGYIRIKDGEQLETKQFANYSKQSYDLALDITHTNPKDQFLKLDKSLDNYVSIGD